MNRRRTSIAISGGASPVRSWPRRAWSWPAARVAVWASPENCMSTAFSISLACCWNSSSARLARSSPARSLSSLRGAAAAATGLKPMMQSWSTPLASMKSVVGGPMIFSRSRASMPLSRSKRHGHFQLLSRILDRLGRRVRMVEAHGQHGHLVVVLVLCVQLLDHRDHRIPLRDIGPPEVDHGRLARQRLAAPRLALEIDKLELRQFLAHEVIRPGLHEGPRLLHALGRCRTGRPSDRYRRQGGHARN